MLHLDIPTRADILRLAAHEGGALSIHLPTTPLSQDARADATVLRNALRDAMAGPAAAALPRGEGEAIAEEVEAVAADDAFWAQQAHSLAVFASPRGVVTFRLANRLQPLVHLGARFRLKPLLRALAFPHAGHVLAFSRGAVRLVEVLPDQPARTVRIPELPRDAADALGAGSHVARDGMMRSGEATSGRAIMLRHARAVDAALRPVLAGSEAPLVLAGSDPALSAFRAVCSFPHLAAQVIAGNADDLPDHALAEGARAALDAHHAAMVQSAREDYAARSAQGRATCDLGTAARAAAMGAVQSLIVCMDAVVPGRMDADGAVAFGGEDDLVEAIALRALEGGARVLAVRGDEVPGGCELAAVLRHPV